ncbi:MAG: histidinol-phosphatase HisJ family protein [Ruminococcaceae bacterium]|nr:histidinol-phosphatase HisJ family protein [Oscillospiraceae bacterium]
MKYTQNLHTHCTYCDGKNTPREIAECALKKGFDSLGFSCHSPMFYAPTYTKFAPVHEDYKKEILTLKQEYKDKLDIFLGLEFDIFSKVDLTGFDYIIGAAHYFHIGDEYIAYDRDSATVKRVIDEYFGGDGLKYARMYYEDMARLPEYAHIDIVGHFDLITKHVENTDFFDTESPLYRSYALNALHTLAEKVNIFEINTGAIARGYRTSPYPQPFILKELKKLGMGIIISSDCHDMNFLDCHFDSALQLLTDCGFGEVYILTKSGFKSVPLY